MKKTISMTYPADPQRVATMLSDSDYQRGRIDRFGLEDATVDVAARGQGFVATIAGSVPPSRLPAAAKRFVRSTISFTPGGVLGASPLMTAPAPETLDITLKARRSTPEPPPRCALPARMPLRSPLRSI